MRTTLERISVLAITVLLLCAPLAGAGAADWTLVRASGDVRVNTDGANWHRISTNSALRAGDSLWTGRNGRALIRNSHSTVIVAPNSMVRIPNRELSSNKSVLFHYLGEVSAQVEKRRGDHFSVQTPYLAAIVKGTRFTVTVTKLTTEVNVQQGRVEVRDLDTGQIVRLGPGGRAATRNVPGSGMQAAPGHNTASNGGAGGEYASTHGGGTSGGGSGVGEPDFGGDSSHSGDLGNSNANPPAYGPGGRGRPGWDNPRGGGIGTPAWERGGWSGPDVPPGGDDDDDDDD